MAKAQQRKVLVAMLHHFNERYRDPFPAHLRIRLNRRAPVCRAGQLEAGASQSAKFGIDAAGKKLTMPA
ncbi:hypothetical protein ACLOJK_001264 [Asimina triloba]